MEVPRVELGSGPLALIRPTQPKKALVVAHRNLSPPQIVIHLGCCHYLPRVQLQLQQSLE